MSRDRYQRSEKGPEASGPKFWTWTLSSVIVLSQVVAFEAGATVVHQPPRSTEDLGPMVNSS